MGGEGGGWDGGSASQIEKAAEASQTGTGARHGSKAVSPVSGFNIETPSMDINLFNAHTPPQKKKKKKKKNHRFPPPPQLSIPPLSAPNLQLPHVYLVRFRYHFSVSISPKVSAHGGRAPRNSSCVLSCGNNSR